MAYILHMRWDTWCHKGIKGIKQDQRDWRPLQGHYIMYVAEDGERRKKVESVREKEGGGEI